MARDQLRFQQFPKASRIERAARKHRLIVARRGTHIALPLLHELSEVLIDDLSAVKALVTGGDGLSVGHNEINDAMKGM
jgi:hypothetical protein